MNVTLPRPTLATFKRHRRPKQVNHQFEIAPEQVPLSAKGIYRHLMLTPDGLYAWYLLGPERWRFKSTDHREAVLDGQNLRWADLAGHRVRPIRVSFPTDYQAWARQFDNATPSPLVNIDVPDAVSFHDWYVGAQHRIAERGTRDSFAYLGVRVTERAHDYDDLETLLSDAPVTGVLGKTRRALREVTETVAREGFNGHPVTAAELGLLTHAMVGFGAPAPDTLVAHCGDGWAPDEMGEFHAPVYAWASTLDKSTTLHVLRDGVTYERHVAVLDVGKIGDRDNTDPSRAPWWTGADSLPFPVVFSGVFDIYSGDDMAKSAEFVRVRAENVAEHITEHDETIPASTGRAIADARRVEDEVKTGDPEVAVRLVGVAHVAVAGATADEANENARELASLYRLKQKITLHHGLGQWARYRGLIPGETGPTKGFLRVLPAYFMPTALPNMATSIGDGVGAYLGTCGNGAFFFDPTYGPLHNMSGFIPVSGSLGSGKSHLVGEIVEVEALRGHRQVIVDGSGLLARLCELPHLKPHAQHIELAGATPGTLNPYWLVPDPKREDFAADDLVGYSQAMRDAAAERRELAADTFIGLQDPDFLKEGRGRIVNSIRRVVNRFGGDYAMNPWVIVRELENSKDPLEQEVGANLRDAATVKGAALIFPEDQMTPRVAGQALPDKMLTVITMRGMQIPKGTDKATWTSAEKMVAPALHLVARYATLAMYRNNHPKGIWIDEGTILAGSEGSIRSAISRWVVETRKTGTALGVIMHNPQAFLKIDPEIGNLIGAAFVGRTTEPSAIKAWMLMWGIPEGHGYEKVFRSLPLGEGHFLHYDWFREVDKVVIDAQWRPDLMKVLNTTPPKRVRALDAVDQEPTPVEAVAV